MKLKLIKSLIFMNIIMTFFILTAYADSQNEEYYISNAEELKMFAEEVNNGNNFEGIKVLLTKDINLNCDEENQWIPIGNCNVDAGNKASETDDKNSFKGEFDRKQSYY